MKLLNDLEKKNTLTAWQRNFVKGCRKCMKRYGGLTEKQKAILESIEKECNDCVTKCGF